MAYKEVSVKQPLLLTILPYISIIIFFAFWEGVVRSGIIPNTLLASPSQVFAAFIDKLSNPNPDGAIMATHAWTSIQEAFIGYVLSLVVGIPLGLAMGWFNVVEGSIPPDLRNLSVPSPPSRGFRLPFSGSASALPVRYSSSGSRASCLASSTPTSACA